MNAILLTSNADARADLLPRPAAASYVSAPCGGTTANDESLQETMVKPRFQENPAGSYRKWANGVVGVEMALFVSVQAVMLVCIVLVAAQLFATA